jgi:hypothetical protein
MQESGKEAERAKASPGLDNPRRFLLVSSHRTHPIGPSFWLTLSNIVKYGTDYRIVGVRVTSKRCPGRSLQVIAGSRMEQGRK